MTSRDPVNPLTVDVIVDDGIALPLEREQLAEAAIAAARYRGCRFGEIGIRVTGDEQIQQINRTHLQHDYPTDVISFGYAFQPPDVEGELVVSVQTAVRQARELDWPAASELILYVVHGTLHLCGMDDLQPKPRSEMRMAERAILRQLGISGMERCAVDPDEGGTTGDEADSLANDSLANDSLANQSMATHSPIKETRA
jgi:probable rRNA maturation factor